MKINFNHRQYIFERDWQFHYSPKKKSSKKRIRRVNIRPVSFEKFRINQFVQKKELATQEIG